MTLVAKNPDGSTEGRDPRRVGVAALVAAGHSNQPLLKVIRAKCLDCSAGQLGEVAKCTATGCALWPFRMRSNPFRSRSSTRPPPFKKTSLIATDSNAAAPSTEVAANG
jgi:hypothetical protein